MGLFSTIGSVIAPGIGTAIGAGLDYAQSSKAAKGAQGQMAGLSQEQYQRALPWDVSGALGGITYDREGKAISTTLDPTLQAQMDRLLGRATTTGEQISAYSTDPVEFGMELAAQKRALRDPSRERERLALENRLLGQGMLGSTGGAGRIRAAEEAYGQQDLADEATSLQQALTMGGTLRDWETQDLERATDLGKLPMQYQALATSGKIGSDPYAQSRVQAAGNVYQQKQSALSGLGGMLGGSSIGGSIDGFFGGYGDDSDDGGFGWGNDGTGMDGFTFS